MISPSDLAEKLQRPFVEVSKAMELFKLFEVAELIEPNEILYQVCSNCVSKGSTRIKLPIWIYHLSPYYVYPS